MIGKGWRRDGGVVVGGLKSQGAGNNWRQEGREEREEKQIKKAT